MCRDDRASDPSADHLGHIADADHLAGVIAEPLSTSAPIAYELAPQICRQGRRGADCSAYHGVWQYLRLAQVVRAVRVDGPLFVAAAARLARVGQLRRVLICGSADYSMLAYLGHAAQMAGARTTFDVIDQCQTALRLNAWYGEQRGLSVRTFATDALAYAPDQPYDLICTHSFLCWVDYKSRPALAKAWHDWLRPGGHLYLSNRTDSVIGLDVTRDHDQRIADMTDTFFRQCSKRQIKLPADRQTFTELIRGYGDFALHRRRDMTRDILVQWLADAGLTLEFSTPVSDVVPNAKDLSSTPYKTDGRPRMWFLASRP